MMTNKKVLRIRALSIPALFAAIGVVLFTPAHAADIGISFNEISVGGGPETLTVTGFAGAVISGTTNNWTITLPGITLSSADLPQDWVEKAGDTGFNVLSIAASNQIQLQSEHAEVGTSDNFCGTGSPLALGVTCFIGSDGAGNSYFATVTEQVAAVPEPGSVFLLLSGCIALGLAYRSRKQRFTQAPRS
jgi:hypothetical protein